MKLNDNRVQFNNKVGYYYYINNQRYLLKKKVCKTCKEVFLGRSYKSSEKESIYCSQSCRSKQPCVNRQREKHWNWKGGRIKDNHGYIQVLLNKTHPANYDGYVLEHVLVMEKLLGRYLSKQENVHHINGIRNDNRPENLELWSTFQPKGQRVSDKIKWAKEILKKYEKKYE